MLTMEFKYIRTVLGLLVLSTTCVHALRCFVCQNVNEGPCFDPVGQNAATAACEDFVGPGHNDYVCGRVLVTASAANIRAITRGCSLESRFQADCQSLADSAPDLADVDCTSCNTNLCNSSNKFALASVTFVTVSFLITKLF